MSYRKYHTRSKIRSIRPKKLIIQRPAFWLSLCIFILVTVAIYFIAFFPKFQVVHLQVSGNESTNVEDIERVIQPSLSRKFGGSLVAISSKSIFLVNKNRVIRDIVKHFPIIEKVTVQKKMPNIISLIIEERKPVAMFCQAPEDCFLIDRHGVIFQETNDDQGDMVVLSGEAGSKKALMGENVVLANTINTIFKIGDSLKNNFQVIVTAVLVSDPLVLKTSEGWEIYLNPDANVELQIAKMNSLLEGEITFEERQKLEYIYLQYQDRAYYK